MREDLDDTDSNEKEDDSLSKTLLDSLAKENETLRKDSIRKSHEYAELMQKYSTLSAEYSEIEAVVERASADLDTFQAQKARVNDTIRCLRNDKKSKEKEINELKERMRQMSIERSDLLDECSGLKSEIQSLEKQLHGSLLKLQSSHESEVSTLKSRITTLLTQVSAMEKAALERESHIASLNATIERQETDLDKLRRDLNALEKSEQTYKNEYEKSNDRLMKALEDVKSEETAKIILQSKFEERVRSLEQRHAEDKILISQKDALLSSLQNSLQDSKREFILSPQIRSSSAQTDPMNTPTKQSDPSTIKVDFFRSLLYRANDEIKAQIQKIKELERSLAHYASLSNSLRSQTDMKVEIENLRMRLEAVESENEHLKRRSSEHSSSESQTHTLKCKTTPFRLIDHMDNRPNISHMDASLVMGKNDETIFNLDQHIIGLETALANAAAERSPKNLLNETCTDYGNETIQMNEQSVIELKQTLDDRISQFESKIKV